MDKNGAIVFGGGLEAELGVCSTGVVGEGDAGRQLAIIQQGLMMLCKQQVALCLVLECALCDRENMFDEKKTESEVLTGL